MDISQNIKRLLDKNGMTQAEICRITGIPTSLMSNYIKGTKSPSLSNSIKLSQAFGISMDELAGIKEGKHNGPCFALSPETLAVAQAYEAADMEKKKDVRYLLRLPELPEMDEWEETS